jgi:hypothetical protein
MYIVIPDAANASGARVGKEKERKTKDDVEEKAVHPQKTSEPPSHRGAVWFS